MTYARMIARTAAIASSPDRPSGPATREAIKSPRRVIPPRSRLTCHRVAVIADMEISWRARGAADGSDARQRAASRAEDRQSDLRSQTAPGWRVGRWSPRWDDRAPGRAG